MTTQAKSRNGIRAINQRSITLASAATLLMLGVKAASVHAVGLTYIEASDLSNLQPTSAINSSTSTGADNLWGFRPLGAGGNVFESNVAPEDSPQLTQTIGGLTPGTSYDFYTAFWSDDDENWAINTGTNPGNLTLYSFNGNYGGTPVAGSTIALSAAGAVWDVLPPATISAPNAIFREGPTGDETDRLMLLGKAGTATADGSGQVNIFIDDIAAGGSGRRSWLDGVAYVPAGTPIALTATINAATGNLTLTNPTSTPFQIKSYSISSPAGALNATSWNTVTGHVDGGGNGSFDVDPWTVTSPISPATTPFATLLGEAEGGSNANGGTLAANGGALNFGAVYRKSRFEDIHINLTLTDNTLVTISPQYTGTPISPADFDLSGSITVTDFQTMMTNMHTNVSTLTRAEAFIHGDVNGDLQVNYSDFQLFRAAYELQQGGGSFAALLAHVPEPNSVALLATMGLVMTARFRRRALVASVAIVTCLGFADVSYAVPLLSVDVDTRAGDSTAGPPGTNTVAGFNSFTLTPSTTGALPSSTATISGYTVGVQAVNAAGTAAGGIDDRDRAGPTTAPSLNQLYDDFIFTASGVGLGGGIDLTVSGGALQPNKQYAFSIYTYDMTSTAAPQPRTANWLDGNDGNSIAITTSFSGATQPTTDDQYKFTGLARTDATGKLFLRGRSTTGIASQPGVILNGFTVDIPVELGLEVNTSTGAVRLLNDQTTNFDVAYYEIRSASEALKPATWSSFDDTDFGGSGTWLEAGGSSANILAEGSLTSMRSFAPSASASIGNAFMPGAAQDVKFFYAAPGGVLRTGLVTYVSSGAVVADFNHDGTVNSADLAVWKAAFGLNANGDADNDGDSDGNDFLIWQRRLGATSATAAAAAVPEPATVTLLAAAGLLAALYRKGR